MLMLVLNYYEVVSPALATKLAKLNPQEVAVCSVVRAELFLEPFVVTTESRHWQW